MVGPGVSSPVIIAVVVEVTAWFAVPLAVARLLRRPVLVRLDGGAGEINPESLFRSAERKSSHFLNRGLRGVDRFVEDVSFRRTVVILDRLDGAETVKLFPEERLGAPRAEPSDPNLGRRVCLSVTDLALKFSDELAGELGLGSVSHVQVFKSDKSKGVSCLENRIQSIRV